MEAFGYDMKLGGMVGDEKMQVEPLWPVPSMEISFSVIAEK